jgi:hypothetical protein
MAGNRSQIMIADDHAFVADACRKPLEQDFGHGQSSILNGAAMRGFRSHARTQLLMSMRLQSWLSP